MPYVTFELVVFRCLFSQIVGALAVFPFFLKYKETFYGRFILTEIMV